VKPVVTARLLAKVWSANLVPIVHPKGPLALGIIFARETKTRDTLSFRQERRR